MRLILLCAGLMFAGCATAKKYEVKWTDGAEKEPLWACLPDPENKEQLLCTDFDRIALLWLQHQVEAKSQRL